MKLKKLVSALLVCGLFVTALVDPCAAIKPVEVKAADASESFRNISLAKGYKDLANHNPCVTQKFSADPGVMTYNGRVYVYSTNDGYSSQSSSPATNTYGQIRQINVMSSADMVNWTDHGSIDVAGPSGIAKWAGNSWAPCATHKTINGREKFFLYFANSSNGIGVLTSDSPTGPWKDPLGRALISRSTPGCSSYEITWLFDPAVFVDTDGTGYLYFGGGVPEGKAANPKTARVVKLGSDMTSIAGNPVMIDAPWIFEDSCINKIGNTYYYSYCTNWSGGPLGNARIAYMTSSSPMGPFRYVGTCFNNPGDFFQTAGNNHHTIIEFKGQYYMFYHAEWLNKQMYGSQKGYRTIHVDILPYSNGKFGNAKGTLTGVTQLSNVNPFVSNKASNMCWEGGINVYGSGDTSVAYNRGDWTGVSGVDFGSGAKSVTMRAASVNGSVVRITAGSPNGAVIGYVTIPATGNNNTYKTVTANLNGVTGVKNLFFTASADVVVDSWQFSGNGSGNSGTTQPSEPVQPSTPAVVPGNTVKLDDGWYYIKNVNAQKYVQVEGNTGKAGQNVELRTGTGVDGQKWYLKNVANGYVTLQSALGNFMLDIANGSAADGANLIIYHGYSGDAQQFMLKSTSTNGVYVVATKASKGEKVLDDYEHSKADGANVCQWKYYGNPNQQFVFEKINNQTPGSTTQPSQPAQPETPSQGTGIPSGVTCEYTVVSDWGGSYQAQVVLTNGSKNTLSNWTLTFEYANKISNLWGADFTGQSGTTVSVKAPSWDANLAPGKSVTIQFIASGNSNNKPTGFSVK